MIERTGSEWMVLLLRLYEETSKRMTDDLQKGCGVQNVVLRVKNNASVLYFSFFLQ